MIEWGDLGVLGKHSGCFVIIRYQLGNLFISDIITSHVDCVHVILVLDFR